MAFAATEAPPITREQFRGHARPLAATIAGQAVVLDPKEFTTGSLGWYGNGKIVVEIDGSPVKVQLGLTLTVVKSKELPA